MKRTMCLTGKRPYLSRGEAQAAVRAVRARRNRAAGRKVEQRPYRCEVCGDWHTTSKAQ